MFFLPCFIVIYKVVVYFFFFFQWEPTNYNVGCNARMHVCNRRVWHKFAFLSLSLSLSLFSVPHSRFQLFLFLSYVWSTDSEDARPLGGWEGGWGCLPKLVVRMFPLHWCLRLLGKWTTTVYCCYYSSLFFFVLFSRKHGISLAGYR